MKYFLILLLATNIFCEPEAYVSPKKGWSEFDGEVKQTPVWKKILLYIPNRLIDIWDIFKIDVGVGPSLGANIRVTKYAQAGLRIMAPASIRAGNLGRRSPILLETSNEFGVSPLYVNSRDRIICGSEIGVGVDPLIAGIYVGVCPTEIVDFLGGLIFLDLSNDDFE